MQGQYQLKCEQSVVLNRLTRNCINTNGASTTTHNCKQYFLTL